MQPDYFFTFPSSQTDQKIIESFEWYLENNPKLRQEILTGLELNPFNFEQDYWLEQEYENYLDFCQEQRIHPVTRLRFYTHIGYLLDEKFHKGGEDAKNLNA